MTISDDTTAAINQYSGTSCGHKGGPWLGPQLYYKVPLTAGKTYRARLTLTDFDAALYAFPATTACNDAAINTACASHSSDTRFFSNEQIKITPGASGDWIFTVDAVKANLFGEFTLVIKEDKAAPTVSAPRSWDCESACQDLHATGDWECGKLSFSKGSNCSTTVIPPLAGHSGKGIWGTKLNDCYSPLDNAAGSSSAGCVNADTSDDSVLKFKVALPSSWTSAKLTYYSWEDIYTFYDWAEVYVEGKASSQICPASYSAPTGWVKRTVDLSAHVGKTVEIALHFMATDYSNYAGWYIDDLTVGGS